MRYADYLGPHAALFFVLVGLVYGLLGWRLVRYLAVIDAIVVAIFLAMFIRTGEWLGGSVMAGRSVAIVLLVGLPWLAWRFPRWAVTTMGGLVGYLGTQLLLAGTDLPHMVCVLLGAVGAAFIMAMHLTLYQHSAVVVTGVHGGWLVVAGLVLATTSSGGFCGNIAWLLNSSYSVSLIVISVFSAIMIAIQLSDLGRSADPG
jgi:hypothetical protein